MVAAFTISMLSLLMSVMVIVWNTGDVVAVEDETYVMEEMGARLDDLEEEHDYLLDAEIDATINEKINLGPPSLCSLLPDPGPCGSLVSRWYYLPREEDCIQFPWGGCQGNDNNFVSLDQCRAACQVPQDKPKSSHLLQADSPLMMLKDPPTAQDCHLPPDSGPCEDRITRFYHDGEDCKM